MYVTQGTLQFYSVSLVAAWGEPCLQPVNRTVRFTMSKFKGRLATIFGLPVNILNKKCSRLDHRRHKEINMSTEGGKNMSRPWCEEARRHGKPSAFLRSSNASKRGGRAPAGVVSFLLTPPPLQDETPGATYIVRRSPATVGAGLRTASSR